ESLGIPAGGLRGPHRASSSTRKDDAGSKKLVSARNKPTMKSDVQPCPSEFVLRTAAEEGFAAFTACLPARELQHAASEGSMVAAQRALAAMPSGEWRWCCDRQGDTALHLAAAGGHLHVVGLLVRKSAHLDLRNTRGASALHLACDISHMEVVRLLCEVRADPRLGELRENKVPGLVAAERRASWWSAGAAGHADCGGSGKEQSSTGYLERRIASVEECLKALQGFVSTAATLVTSKGMTALHIAAAADDLELCRLLLSYASSSDAVESAEGATPLMHGLGAGASVGIIQSLLFAHADPALQDARGGSPLHYAAAHGDAAVESVVLLLRARAKVDAKDERGASALAIACLRGAPRIVRTLLVAGASPQSCRALL
ncbi:unnamed protein product, partial [Polarella glacialis]